MRDGMPVFVRVEDYKDVLEVLELLNSKLEEAKSTVARINELKNQEDSELELWQSELTDVEKKISKINSNLLEPKM